MMNENGASSPSLVTRAKAMLLNPKDEWPRIALEPQGINEIFLGYSLPLAAIGPVCGLIGGQVFGYGAFGFSYRPSLMTSLSMAVTSFVLSLVSLFLLMLIVDWLAPKFDGTPGRAKAFKLVAYSMTAGALAGVFGLVPSLAWLGLAGLYSFYLFYVGATPMMAVPPAKVLPFTIITVLCGIVMGLVVGAVAGSVTSIVGGPAMLPTGSVESSGTVEVPGMGKIDVARMEQAAKRAEAAANGQQVAVQASTLQTLLPASIGGFTRTAVESQGLGTAGSNAEGRYEQGEQNFRLSVTDMSALGALTSMGAAMGVTSNKEDADGYEKTETVDGRIVTEKWNRTDKSGEYGTTIADRFMVKAEGQVADIGTLKAAVAGIDAGKLAALAK